MLGVANSWVIYTDFCIGRRRILLLADATFSLTSKTRAIKNSPCLYIYLCLYSPTSCAAFPVHANPWHYSDIHRLPQTEEKTWTSLPYLNLSANFSLVAGMSFECLCACFVFMYLVNQCGISGNRPRNFKPEDFVYLFWLWGLWGYLMVAAYPVH